LVYIKYFCISSLESIILLLIFLGFMHYEEIAPPFYPATF
jgi:hypothetical protein